MATKTFEELKQLAIQIRDEKTNKQNTATRIGTQMLEHLEKLEQDYYDKTTINNRTIEYNVSINHPTSGISGGNKYDLTSAIGQVPAELRHAGLKVTFLNEEGTTETWEFQGGTFTSVASWKKRDAVTIVQELGDGENAVMSQKAVSETIDTMDANIAYSLPFINDEYEEKLTIKLGGYTINGDYVFTAKRASIVLISGKIKTIKVSNGYQCLIYGTDKRNTSLKTVKNWFTGEYSLVTDYLYVYCIIKNDNETDIDGDLSNIISVIYEGKRFDKIPSNNDFIGIVYSILPQCTLNIVGLQNVATITGCLIKDGNVETIQSNYRVTDYLTAKNYTDTLLIWVDGFPSLSDYFVNIALYKKEGDNYRLLQSFANNTSKVYKIPYGIYVRACYRVGIGKGVFCTTDTKRIINSDAIKDAITESIKVTPEQTSISDDGIITYLNNRALFYLKNENISKITIAKGWEFSVAINDEGLNNPITFIKYWVTSYEDPIDAQWVFIVCKRADNSSLVDLSLNNIITIESKGSIIKQIDALKKNVNNLTDELNNYAANYWTGKKIAYFGTSVPAQGYPQIVGEKLGATMFNQAVGASMMRIGVYNTDDELGDDLGLTGVYFTNALLSMSMTQEERKRMFICWTTERRKQWLKDNKGYQDDQLVNVKGYGEYMGGAFQEDNTDETSDNPSSKPTDIFAGNGTTYKEYRKKCYSACWDNSDNIEGDIDFITDKITEHIDGRMENYLSGDNKADLYVFDHFRNDSSESSTDNFLKIPTPANDRRYAIGAFIYLVQQIYLKNPNAKIVIVGHFDNDDVKVQLGHVWEAQEKAANYFGFPLLKLWEVLGIRCSFSVTTQGYWGTDNQWHETGYNGSNHVWKDNSNGALGLNENPRQIEIDGAQIWVHDLSTRQIWCRDDVHPSGTLALNYFAEAIASWLLNLRI